MFLTGSMAAHNFDLFDWPDHWLQRQLLGIIVPRHLSQLFHKCQALVGVLLRHCIYVKLQPGFCVGLHINCIRNRVTCHESRTNRHINFAFNFGLQRSFASKSALSSDRSILKFLFNIDASGVENVARGQVEKQQATNPALAGILLIWAARLPGFDRREQLFLT